VSSEPGARTTVTHTEVSAPTVAGADPAAARILTNFAAFEEQLRRAQQHFERGNQEAAAVGAALAAHVATSTHCGIFWSPRLERMLNAIGRKISDDGTPAPHASSRKAYQKVLHVCTEVHFSGGLTRMISRWITADRDRTNSLALTKHRGPMPDHLLEAVAGSGGQIHRINHRVGGQFAWARELRRLARQHDVIVLHIFCEDVVPLLAFAEPKNFPPVLLLNHADHLFWFGPSISHAVLNLRDAARDLSASRRGIETQRNLLIPTIVDRTVRLRSRGEAKRMLGLDPERVLLVSVARATKYRTMNGVTYADLHVPLLQKHPNAELLVVGAESPDDWGPAIAAVGGRIKPLSNQSDPSAYYEAGDIYVDSYPFVSSTSMMEAAGYAMPPVTIFTAPDAARIFGINHVGLVGTALVAKSIEEYTSTLSRLISDEPYRKRCGEAARAAIAEKHEPAGWLTHLEAVYKQSGELPPLDNSSMLSGNNIEHPSFDEPDRRHEDMFKSSYPLTEHRKAYMGMVPIRQQLAYWNELRREGAFENGRQAAAYLLPEWLKRVLKDRR
jgi:glycosyltransferase involved in cell wall biosynthesis